MPDVQELFRADSVRKISVEPPRPPPSRWRPRPDQLRLLGCVLVGLLGLAVVLFGVVYIRLAARINRRLAGGPFASTLNIYSAPKTIAAGEELTAEALIAWLQQSGYTALSGNPAGWYRVRPAAVEIFPGRDSYPGAEAGLIEFENGKIARIVSLQDNTGRQTFTLDPRLITNLSQQREKRRLVRFAEIPPSLVHAVMSAEDKHFFHHPGFDFLRILKAAYVDFKGAKKAQGASTLTMQLARGFWLEPDKSWRRKIEEVLISMELERRLSKQQIFEDYANQVYLGRSGTFSISGFGEGARVFFGKDLPQLTDAEAALLAGLVQRPSYYNPRRYPDRAGERRNVVLALMRQNGYLNDSEYRAAVLAPVTIAAERPESQESQYFLDLMNDELQTRLDDREKPARSVFTTLDPDLQHAAVDAVHNGIDKVEKELRRRKKPFAAGQPQMALIALDPHTGAIKALVGGRDYLTSQLNRVLAMRQPGSVFKPFVYAAALDSAVEGGPHIFTPASVVADEPHTFFSGRSVYQPGNFHGDFMGSVTLRTALAHSLNAATVALAQSVGYDRVVTIARRAGLNDAIKPTPSVALGAYEATPLEMAGAYTVFANRGMHVTPTTIEMLRAREGKVLYEHDPDPRPALDPRVAYLMVSLLQEVVRSGTGAGVRDYGFTLPAAGKTGTSRDGWFAGFTSRLLCVVWVGFDDNRDLNLEGAHSALPIWAEFMKRASQFPEYRDARPFQPPPGVVSVRLCSETGQLAGDYCPETHWEVFIDGTQPRVQCELHSVDTQRIGEGLLDLMETPPAAPRSSTDPGHK